MHIHFFFFDKGSKIIQCRKGNLFNKYDGTTDFHIGEENEPRPLPISI